MERLGTQGAGGINVGGMEEPGWTWVHSPQGFAVEVKR